MSGYTLAIDFGTTHTAAAIHRDGRTVVIDLEGDGTTRMSSNVWVRPDGTVLTGRSASQQSVLAPARFEATPKRLVGQEHVLLEGVRVPVVDLVAGVLRTVLAAARREQGDAAPSRVHLTHPASWREARLEVLRAGAVAAGMPVVRLVPEPVAAALHVGAARIAAGQHVVVYDFGGGTFDAAVLRRTDTGFDVIGEPKGNDPLGGLTIDFAVLAHLQKGPVGQTARWTELTNPTDAAARRARQQLMGEIRNAKEMLSQHSSWQLWVPGVECEATLTRGELDQLIQRDVDTTIATTEAAVASAGLTMSDVESVFLVGGSSRIPLVADRVWRRLGIRPDTQDDPKLVVALGAAGLGPAGLNRDPQLALRQDFGSSALFSRQPDLSSAAHVSAPPPSRRGYRVAFVVAALLVALGGGGAAAAWTLQHYRNDASPAPQSDSVTDGYTTDSSDGGFTTDSSGGDLTTQSGGPNTATITLYDRLYTGQSEELIDLTVNGQPVSLHPTANDPAKSIDITVEAGTSIEWSGSSRLVLENGTELDFQGSGTIDAPTDGEQFETTLDVATDTLDVQAT